MKIRFDLLVLVSSLISGAAAATAPASSSPPVNFDRDIRGIFSENCYACHGPDEKQRKAKLRLDDRENVFLARKDHSIIVPGHRDQSELWRRLTTSDADDRMPPAKTGKTLSQAQVELIGRWIDQGATWQVHWSFVTPTRPVIPNVKNSSWPRNPIDNFVLARLEKEGLPPSPPADKPTLVRRAALDLTGLPPTLEEVDSFVADGSSDAYEKVVDRLLDSAPYGEQMARDWLDAARYADTHGFHIDAERVIWPYRDWVINAFNQNKPFDQFTIEQLAGDLLPNPTVQQLVATGFDRCNMSTGEGGAIEQEYLVKYAIDRATTMGTVFLGLTVGCAQCHDHKYDPIRQKEFYSLYAFFNNVAEAGLDGNKPNPDPFIKVASPTQTQQSAQFRAQIASIQKQLDGPMPELDAKQTEWQTAWQNKLRPDWKTLNPEQFASKGGATLKKLSDLSVLAEGKVPDHEIYEVAAATDARHISAIRLEALTHDSLPHKGAGRSDNANFVLSEFELEAAPRAHLDQRRKINFISALADFSQPKFEIEKAIDGNAKTGWAVEGQNRRENRTALFIPAEPIDFDGGAMLYFRLKHESPITQHAIGRFRLSVSGNAELFSLAPTTVGVWHLIGPFQPKNNEDPYDASFPPEREIDLAKSYDDGKLKWQNKPDLTDGKPQTLAGENVATYLYRVIKTPEARKVTLSFGSDDAIKVWLNGKPILEKKVMRGVEPDQDKVAVTLSPGENQLLMKVVNYSGGYGFYFKKTDQDEGDLPQSLAQIFATGTTLTDAQKKTVREFYRRGHSPEWRQLAADLEKVQKQQKDLDDKIPTTLVMKEKEDRREAHVLIRGEYDRPSDKVDPGVPAFLPPLPKDQRVDRLALAKWLVDPKHPLTARVTVNRFWQHYFGVGLVKTAEDFGTQGERPSNPDLLDWLATEFIRSGWDVKYIQRLIVTSATYQQSSKVSPELKSRDPENRLLARGPRFRMDAEAIRDNALAIAGLLVRNVGGHSVKPYEPPGLWEAVSYGYKQSYNQGHGTDLYRRSLYTFWKRQSPPAAMVTLDAPSRETCIVRRPRTNTPLQALLLLNDTTYIEAARALAQRILTEQKGDLAKRLTFGFRLATARTPRPDELEILIRKYEQHLEHYQKNKEAARQLLSLGEIKTADKFDTAELAAWTTIANILLNLDETITKG